MTTVMILAASSVPSLGAQDAIPLFDGATLDGWQTLDGKPVTVGWEVVEGTLHLAAGDRRGGDIVTVREFRDFDLQFDWRISAKGNNGLKYRVRKYGDRVLGCEYQILDDAAWTASLKPKGLTGSLYDVYEPNDAKSLNPVGEFNHSRIVVRGNHIEHWLNGRLIVSAEVGSREWDRRIAESKFADVEGFGRNRLGRIMLTDHNDEVWFRNIVLTPLAAPEAVAAARPLRQATLGHACRLRRAHWLQTPGTTRLRWLRGR